MKKNIYISLLCSNLHIIYIIFLCSLKNKSLFDYLVSNNNLKKRNDILICMITINSISKSPLNSIRATLITRVSNC